MDQRVSSTTRSVGIANDIELFNDWTRDITVIFLLLSPLSLLAYILICKYRRKQDLELEQSRIVQAIDDDAFASKFVILASTIALTVSEGAILLLPFSVLANETRHSFPGNYYLQWMSSSLIHGLWNLISLFSNVSLVTLILAYFISESEGFENSRKGIFSRVKEALITVAFVFIFVFGFVLLLWHFVNDETWSLLSFSNLKNFHLPWFYTCLSFVGAVILLFATPYGYAQMFSIVGSLVKRPLLSLETSVEYLSSSPRGHSESELLLKGSRDQSALELTPAELEEELEEYLNPSFFRRTLLYPLLMMLMMVWTSFCILVCFINLVSMTLGLRDLPGVSRLADVGITSLSSLGMVGAALEILIIGYTVVAFLVGFYNFPWMGQLMPKSHDTSLTKIVANCAVILLLSSALPLFVRVIGITNFDLLGNFVHISWLRNLKVIVGYNMAYLIFSVLALTAHASKSAWHGICQRLKIGTSGIKKVAQRSGHSALRERLTDLVASKLLHSFTAKNGYLKKQV